MAYGELKVDSITFTNGGTDTTVSVSGLVLNPTFVGNITTTGTISGNVILGGTTVSGATVTGTTASFTSGVFTNISGGTHTITSGVFDDGTAAAPSITFVGDLDTGIYSPGANKVALTTNGTERVEFGTSEVVFNNGGANYDFRIEGNTEANLLFVDGNDRIGVAVTPANNTRLDVNGTYAGNVTAVAALAINCSNGNYFTKTISANSTFTFSNVASSRAISFTLELTHTSGTVTWPASVKWPSDTAPTLTTGKTHLFMFVTDDGGTRWRGAALVDYVN